MDTRIIGTSESENVSEAGDVDNIHLSVGNSTRRRGQRLASFNVAHLARTKPPGQEYSAPARIRRTLLTHLSWQLLLGRLPIISWVKNYDIKQDLVNDIICGFTIAVFQVPQGMAYAMLSNVPPVYGLYTSFFPVLVYALMGTSKQASVGTYSITSLMTGVVVSKWAVMPPKVTRGLRQNDTDDDWTSTVPPPTPDSSGNLPLYPIDVAVAMTVLCGLYLLAFSACRMGALSVYLSEHLVSGFTCGAALHVASSQVKTLFDIPLTSFSGPLKLVYTYIEFFKILGSSNPVTVGTSAAAILAMVLVKEVLNPRLKKYTRIPCPIELILVVVGTVLSNYLDLTGEHGVQVVKDIKTGFPSPSVPRWDALGSLASETAAVAVIAFSSTVSLGKIFASKHGYKIDANQELLALGVGNILGGFFTCIPSAGSISRSAVQDNAGGKTQLVSLISAAGMLVVLLALGKLLDGLPNCILSAIIFVSLKGMILQAKDLRRYWRLSKIDGAIWLVTFLAVVLLDVDLGLGVGVGFSLVTLLLRSQRPQHEWLGKVTNSDIYVSLRKYALARQVPGARIYHFGGPLHFGNVEVFQKDIIREAQLTGPVQDTKKSGSFSCAISCLPVPQQVGLEKGEKVVRHMIVDCSAIGFLDSAGLTALRNTRRELERLGMTFSLAACNPSVFQMLCKDGFTEEGDGVFLTIQDALVYLHQQDQNKQGDHILDPDPTSEHM